MPGPTLWLSFLAGADGGPAPSLRTGSERGAPLDLSDRARWVLAAIGLPRELVPDTASDERQSARLGSRLWSSGEIMARIPYQHRSTIRHALSDLRELLGARGLKLDDYLLIDTARGRYGVHAGRVVVDLLELHERRHEPDALDRRLDEALGDRGRARLAPVCAHLLAPPVLDELEQAIAASVARAVQAVPDPEPVDERAAEGPIAADPAARPAVAAGHSAPPRPDASRRPRAWRPPPRRRVAWLPVLAGIVAVAVAVVVLAEPGRARTTIRADGPPRVEVSGGLAHTWSDPLTAGGRMGREIFGGEHVTIACRTHGFVVPDGNRWWYLIDSRPWSRRYFVTADSFYNDGRTTGSLRGSAFVDPKVARCSHLPSSFR